MNEIEQLAINRDPEILIRACRIWKYGTKDDFWKLVELYPRPILFMEFLYKDRGAKGRWVGVVMDALCVLAEEAGLI